jgi:WD40 repeat protein
MAGIQLWDLNQSQPTLTPKPKVLIRQGADWKPGADPKTGYRGISALAITRDGTIAAAGKYDGQMRLWDLSGAAPSLRANLSPARSVEGSGKLRFLPDERMLITVSSGGMLQLWDVATGQKLREWSFGHILSLDVAPDGRHIAVGTADNNLYILRLSGLLSSGLARWPVIRLYSQFAAAGGQTWRLPTD